MKIRNSLYLMLKLRWVKEKIIICNKKIDQGVTLGENEATSFEIFSESSNWTLNKLNCNWLFLLLLGYWILTAEFGFLQVIFYKKTSCTQTEHTKDNFQDNFFFNGFAEAFWILYLFFHIPYFWSKIWDDSSAVVQKKWKFKMEI